MLTFFINIETYVNNVLLIFNKTYKRYSSDLTYFSSFWNKKILKIEILRSKRFIENLNFFINTIKKKLFIEKLKEKFAKENIKKNFAKSSEKLQKKTKAHLLVWSDLKMCPKYFFY
jgi:hypothetical protein